MPDQFRLYLGRRYNRLKNKQGGDTANRQNVGLDLAHNQGVSSRTVERAGAFVSARKVIDRSMHNLFLIAIDVIRKQ
ncbi:MAG: hypothetical protein H6936_17125 [Burkholderiales bacterium]|nr:hypothetical protein [Nitrosomonas sp.]MCP5276534.1 hypothetical protein [Burkholderiales bacterium]